MERLEDPPKSSFSSRLRSLGSSVSTKDGHQHQSGRGQKCSVLVMVGQSMSTFLQSSVSKLLWESVNGGSKGLLSPVNLFWTYSVDSLRGMSRHWLQIQLSWVPRWTVTQYNYNFIGHLPRLCPVIFLFLHTLILFCEYPSFPLVFFSCGGKSTQGEIIWWGACPASSWGGKASCHQSMALNTYIRLISWKSCWGHEGLKSWRKAV